MIFLPGIDPIADIQEALDNVIEAAKPGDTPLQVLAHPDSCFSFSRSWDVPTYILQRSVLERSRPRIKVPCENLASDPGKNCWTEPSRLGVCTSLFQSSRGQPAILFVGIDVQYLSRSLSLARGRARCLSLSLSLSHTHTFALSLSLSMSQVIILHSTVPREEQDVALSPALAGHCKVCCVCVCVCVWERERER